MRLRDYFNIIPLLVFAAVASVHSIYPSVYDPRTRQYGPFEGSWPFQGNYPPNPMGSYMPPYAAPYMNPYSSAYMNPNPSPYMNPNPAPYMNPNPAPYMNSYPGPGMNPYSAQGFNPYPDPYRNSYAANSRNPNPAEAHPHNLPHPGEGAPSQQHPAYEDLHALVQHRLPGFFGKHEHRLLWSPKLKPEEQGAGNAQAGFHGQTEPPIPREPERNEDYASTNETDITYKGYHSSANQTETKFKDVETNGDHTTSNQTDTNLKGHESNESSSELTNPEGHGSNESDNQPVNPEDHTITKRQVNNSPDSISELKDRLYTEFSKTLSLGDYYSSDDLIKLYIHTLLHPSEFKHAKMYTEYIAWLIALKYNIQVSPSTVLQMYPQFASVGKHGTMINPTKPDSPSLGPPGGNNLIPGNYTLYYKEGHKKQTRGTYNKLFFGAKGSIYDDYKSGSLGDQTI